MSGFGGAPVVVRLWPPKTLPVVRLRGNPNHVPAGTPEGGQFAPAPGGGGGMAQQHERTMDRWMTNYISVNKAARAGKVTDETKALDAAIAAAPELPVGSVVFRGVSLDPLDATHRYVLENLAKGHTILEQGFAAVTTDKSIADDFASGGDTGNVEVVFRITTTEAMHAAEVNSGLRERVFARRTMYKVINVSNSKTVRTVDVVVWQR